MHHDQLKWTSIKWHQFQSLKNLNDIAFATKEHKTILFADPNVYVVSKHATELKHRIKQVIKFQWHKINF